MISKKKVKMKRVVSKRISKLNNNSNNKGAVKQQLKWLNNNINSTICVYVSIVYKLDYIRIQDWTEDIEEEGG